MPDERVLRLVINASRIFAGVMKDGTNRRLILDDRLDPFAPTFIREEIWKHMDKLIRYSRLTSEEAGKMIERLLAHVSVVDDDAFSDRLAEAEKAMAGIDPDDSAYIALAMAINVEGIWTEDRHYWKQQLVRPFSTRDVLAALPRVDPDDRPAS